jgi:hypothetical protein
MIWSCHGRLGIAYRINRQPDSKSWVLLLHFIGAEDELEPSTEPSYCARIFPGTVLCLAWGRHISARSVDVPCLQTQCTSHQAAVCFIQYRPIAVKTTEGSSVCILMTLQRNGLDLRVLSFNKRISRFIITTRDANRSPPKVSPVVHLCFLVQIFT